MKIKMNDFHSPKLGGGGAAPPQLKSYGGKLPPLPPPPPPVPASLVLTPASDPSVPPSATPLHVLLVDLDLFFSELK